MTNRQKKINALLQQDFAEILHLFLHQHNLKKQVVSVTAVRVTPDLQIAKVCLSVFPFSEAKHILNLIEEERGKIKNTLAKRIRNQLRVVPRPPVFYRRFSSENRKNRSVFAQSRKPPEALILLCRFRFLSLVDIAYLQQISTPFSSLATLLLLL